jgi:hypothetical protein
MEYVLGFYLVGVVLTSLALVASLLYRPIKDMNNFETVYMCILTIIVWPVFVGYIAYMKYKGIKVV